jgi:hypothetical protein
MTPSQIITIINVAALSLTVANLREAYTLRADNTRAFTEMCDQNRRTVDMAAQTNHVVRRAFVDLKIGEPPGYAADEASILDAGSSIRRFCAKYPGKIK